MMMAAVSLIREHGVLDAQAVRAGLEGNICRCTGYQGIVRAVEDASRRMASSEGPR
jgi:carbon-monoxide dehydrogenase small subunit